MIRITKPEDDRLLFTCGETLWYLRCSYMTLRKIINQGLIVPSKVNKRNMFLKADLDTYLQAPKRALIDNVKKLLKEGWGKYIRE